VLRLVRSGMDNIIHQLATFSVAESNWKAGCVERHLSGLERGKGREALPIATHRKNIHERTFYGENGTKRNTF